MMRIGGGYPNERPERRTMPRQASKLTPEQLAAAQARRRRVRGRIGDFIGGMLWGCAVLFGCWVIMGW